MAAFTAVAFIFTCLMRFGEAIVQIDMTTSCTSTQFYDSTNMYCVECDRGCSSDGTGDNCNKEPDYDHVDPYGNALRCNCKAGYLQEVSWSTEYDDADGDWPTGENVGFTCILGYRGDRSVLSNGAGYSRCGPTTSGLKVDETGTGSIGDCYCGTENTDGTFGLRVLVETNGGGGYANKSCVTCADDAAVVTAAGTYAGVVYAVDYYSCQRCPDPHMNMALDQCASCDKTAGYALEPFGNLAVGAKFCIYENHATFITTSYSTADAYKVTYVSVQASEDARANTAFTLDESYTMKHYFVNASANCYFYKGPENLANCQTLANLCVLVMYDTEHPACEAYRDIEGLRGSGNLQQNGWGEALPWLYYEETAPVVRYAEDIDMVLGFSSTASGVDASRLTFWLSVFAINGTWLGMQELGTQLFYCSASAPDTHHGGGSSSSTAWLNYGNNFRKNFQCDLSTLIDKEPLFYELFVQDVGASTGDGSEGSLYPCPVLLKDYVDADSGRINRNRVKDDEDNDAFVRRFMLYDVLTGSSSGYEGAFTPPGYELGEGEEINPYPRVIRYAKEIKLVLKGLPDDASQIYPPVLEIEYQERMPDGGNWGEGMKKDQIKFGVDYSQDRQDDYHNTFSAFFIVTSVMAGITGIFRFVYWGFRNDRIASKERRDEGAAMGQAQSLLSGVGSDAMLRGRECEACQRFFRSGYWCGTVMLCHAFTLYNFALIFSLTTCFFVFFKMQSRDMAAFVLLPPRNGDWEDGEENPYKFIWVLIYCCFFSQTAFVAHLIYIQCTAEIFFVDMESRRSAGAPGGSGGLGSATMVGRRQELAPLNGGGGGGGGGGGPAFDPAADSGVSAWRRIFIANEWNKLQCTRRTSIEFTLFWMAFALIGQDLQYVAMPQPDINNHDSAQCGEDDHFHMYLRFASHTWWFVCLELFQLLGMQLMRYVDACFKCQTHPFEMRGELYVDLCTQAKVSVIILDEAYHGYVLYCDSNADTADTSLKHLTAQLLLETSGTHMRRGPADLANRPGFEDVQAFELYLSDGFLKWYKNLKRKLEDMAKNADLSDAMAAAGRRNRSSGGQGPVGEGGDLRIQRGGLPGGNRGGAGACGSCRATLAQRNAVLQVGSMEVLNDKLRKFLRRQYKGDLAWEATESFYGQWNSWIYRRLRRPPDMVRSAASENILVPDVYGRFTSLSLYGIEFELWLQNVLTMAMCDLWFNDVMTSIFCVYMLDQFFRLCRQFFGQNNLAQTSLVDKSFLSGS